MSQEPKNETPDAAIGPHFSTDPDAEVAAWTEIEPGRFMPRRVRGSNLGRALG
ncbi:MAG: hypothetical protein L0211_22750 [Planctomycetaceae bacterium]|nr:hypothetical protein [Planctomycetaceae bacterium]